MRSKTLRIFTLCGLLLVLAGSWAYAAYYDRPREFDVAGAYTQAASGMVFPEAVGEFQRQGLVSYNSEGTDESVDYLFDDGVNQVVVSVYVYPVPLSIGAGLAQALSPEEFARNKLLLGEQFFAEEEDLVLAGHPNAEILDERAIFFDQRGTSHPGFAATFRFEDEFFGEVRPILSELHLFSLVGGDWMVKYRISYAEGFDGAAPAMMFIDALPWTIKGVR